GRALPGAQLQYSHSDGPRDYELSLQRDPNFNDDMGRANITRMDAGGAAIRSEETRWASGGNVQLNGSAKLPVMGGDFSTNSSVQMSDFDGGTVYAAMPVPQVYASTSHDLN